MNAFHIKNITTFYHQLFKTLVEKPQYEDEEGSYLLGVNLELDNVKNFFVHHQEAIVERGVAKGIRSFLEYQTDYHKEIFLNPGDQRVEYYLLHPKEVSAISLFKIISARLLSIYFENPKWESKKFYMIFPKIVLNDADKNLAKSLIKSSFKIYSTEPLFYDLLTLEDIKETLKQPNSSSNLFIRTMQHVLERNPEIENK